MPAQWHTFDFTAGRPEIYKDAFERLPESRGKTPQVFRCTHGGWGAARASPNPSTVLRILKLSQRACARRLPNVTIARLSQPETRRAIAGTIETLSYVRRARRISTYSIVSVL